MSANTEVEEAESRPKLEIKVPQLIGGAAASVVAAILGSRLGISGTLIGAAASSIVFSLFSPFVVFSIERSHHSLRGVAGRRRASGEEAETTADADAEGGATVAPEPTPVRRKVPVGLFLLGLAATAIATFAISLGVITAGETATGRSVDGGYTTTVQGATQGDAATLPATKSTTSAAKTHVPAAASASATAAASATTTPSATPAPEVPASATPSASSTPQATASPSASVAVKQATPQAATLQPSAAATPTPTPTA